MINLIDPYENGNENVDVVNRIANLMCEIRCSGGFAGQMNRFALAYYSYLIQYNGKDVGFIYATGEYRYPSGLFIDMALLKDYRGKGIGKMVLDMFVNKHNDTLMFGEVKVNNVASNTISGEIGVSIAPGYYLFPKEMYNEFVQSGELEVFLNAMKKEEKSASEVLRRVMNERK